MYPKTQVKWVWMGNDVMSAEGQFRSQWYAKLQTDSMKHKSQNPCWMLEKLLPVHQRESKENWFKIDKYIIGGCSTSLPVTFIRLFSSSPPCFPDSMLYCSFSLSSLMHMKQFRNIIMYKRSSRRNETYRNLWRHSGSQTCSGAGRSGPFYSGSASSLPGLRQGTFQPAFPHPQLGGRRSQRVPLGHPSAAPPPDLTHLLPEASTQILAPRRSHLWLVRANSFLSS